MRIRLKANNIAILGLIGLLTLLASSCTKVRVQTAGGTLKFSVDTLKFDTIFTAAGSFTTGVVVYNPQNEEVVISSVRLNEGQYSYFHLNVDGWPVNGGFSSPSIKIAAHDSMYVFATVDINPTNKLTPFIVTDSLILTMNGQNFYVPFTAYGQNAHYIVDSILAGTNIVWDTTLPYVIINSAEVNVGSTLTIKPGTRVYMHQNSGLVVLGKLLVQGTATDTVVFQGDRLDRAYFGHQGYPGEWGGIYFGSQSNGSVLSYTRIENCGNGALSNIPAGIVVFMDSVNYNNPNLTPQLSLNNCIIENSFGYGIYSWQGTIVASDCNVNTTGQQALAVVQGGYDSMVNCTFANYGTSLVAHAGYSTLAVLNYYSDGVAGDPVIYDNLDAVFHNCIVYGSLDSEMVCDTTGSPSGAKARLLMDHCLLKIGTVTEPFVQFLDCIANQDPMFKNTTTGDFHLLSGSHAIDSGSYPAPDANLEGTAWPGTNPNIGCY